MVVGGREEAVPEAFLEGGGTWRGNKGGPGPRGQPPSGGKPVQEGQETEKVLKNRVSLERG